MKKITVLFSIIVLSSTLFSQNTLWFGDGNVYKTYDSTFSEDGFISYLDKKDKVKYADTLDVFAIINGNDTVFFYENEDYPLEKAKWFVKGEIAGKDYNNKKIYYSGFFVGLTTPFILAASDVPSFLFPLAPTIYVASVSSVNPENKNNNLPEDLLQNEDFVRGYKFSATRKKIKNTVIYTSAGLIISLVVLGFSS